MTEPYCAVLTGDVVGSSELSPEEHRRVVELIKSVKKVFSNAVIGTIDVFSGDSWQMLFSDFGSALRSALYLRAILKMEKDFSVDSRISMAWGRLDMGQVNTQRISESTGELFTFSGRGVQGLKKPMLMCFSAPRRPAFSAAVDSSFRLMDTLVRQWSREQARAVAGTLLGRTQAEIAGEFGIGQSSVNKSLQAAHWPEIESTLEILESAGKTTLTGDNY